MTSAEGDFFTRRHMVTLAEQYGVTDVLCCGATGPKAMQLVASMLDVPIPLELWEFGEHIGNLYVGGLQIVVSGAEPDNGPATNCATNTLAARVTYPDLARDHILIVDAPSDIYCCLASTGEIARYPSIEVPGGEVTRWSSLHEWIEWAFLYAKQLEELEDAM